MPVGDIIRTARERLGWTRFQLSQKVGIDPSAISRIEKGERLPGPDVAHNLEGALKLKKGLLTNSVIAEKKRRRERIRQLKQLIYKSTLSVEEIQQRLRESEEERGKNRSEA
jgi:ribosome-binding protein aMBF1 (putative translation factor)